MNRPEDRPDPNKCMRCDNWLPKEERTGKPEICGWCHESINKSDRL